MSSSFVGAGILNIITESLYDNPIVVFREYVQNSMDSFLENENADNQCIKIWLEDNSLYFLDNGKGIDEAIFYDKMKQIASSSKLKQKNMGYKGIGRLSGVPYCKKLSFVNIVDYKNKKAQSFVINRIEYDKIRNNRSDLSMSFDELMGKIGTYNKSFCFDDDKFMRAIKKYDGLLKSTNTGFLVVLENISEVLNKIINSDTFYDELNWLLPVDFNDDIYDSEQKELFKDLTSKIDNQNPIVNYCDITFNDVEIKRPIKKSMLRDFVCKSDYKFAIGFHSFSGNKIVIDSSNSFSGIRIYIDNMLLCDENELLRMLDSFDLLEHTINGQLQSVKGIGAMIYITDKVSISANARRTFIEMTDIASIDFLKLLSEFVNNVYKARYALSNYASALNKTTTASVKVEEYRIKAVESLRLLAQENIEINEKNIDFEKMKDSDKRRMIKNAISEKLNFKIREYINSLSNLELENSFESFIEWLKK